MKYYIVYNESTKELVSIGTVLADPLPEGLVSRELTKADYDKLSTTEYRWDTEALDFVFLLPPLVNNQTITSSTDLPAGQYTFIVDATEGAVELTPDPEGGEYTIIKVDDTNNPVTFKATVNGLQNMNLVNQYANMTLIGSGTTYFLKGNN